MRTFTPANASKYLRALEDEKSSLLKKEQRRCVYLAAVGEEPEVPSYDYRATRARVAQINATVRAVRHALHAHNVVTMLPDLGMSVDEALVELAQLTLERRVLDDMRGREHRVRYDELYNGGRYDPFGLGYGRHRREGSQRDVVEYVYANYDPNLAESDYREVSQRIIDLQAAIDYSNQTTSFEVEV